MMCQWLGEAFNGTDIPLLVLFFVVLLAIYTVRSLNNRLYTAKAHVSR